MSFHKLELDKDFDDLLVEVSHLRPAISHIVEFMNTPDEEITEILPEFEDSLLEVYLRAVNSQTILNSMDSKIANFMS